MPGYSYGISAKRCQVGSVLAKLENTVCSKCYALRGHYVHEGVKKAHEKRFLGLTDPQWVEAMTFMIRLRKCKYFRWHDSGDLQSVSHLENIAEVARRCAKTRFWLPTRERIFVHEYLRRHGSFPKNLVVRVSATNIDGPPPVGFPNTSTVVTKDASCPAPQQGNKCGDCRACWNPRKKNVSYAKH